MMLNALYAFLFNPYLYVNRYCHHVYFICEEANAPERSSNLPQATNEEVSELGSGPTLDSKPMFATTLLYLAALTFSIMREGNINFLATMRM
jgi:hypothetical protein